MRRTTKKKLILIFMLLTNFLYLNSKIFNFNNLKNKIKNNKLILSAAFLGLWIFIDIKNGKKKLDILSNRLNVFKNNKAQIELELNNYFNENIIYENYKKEKMTKFKEIEDLNKKALNENKLTFNIFSKFLNKNNKITDLDKIYSVDFEALIYQKIKQQETEKQKLNILNDRLNVFKNNKAQIELELNNYFNENIINENYITTTIKKFKDEEALNKTALSKNKLTLNIYLKKGKDVIENLEKDHFIVFETLINQKIKEQEIKINELDKYFKDYSNLYYLYQYNDLSFFDKKKHEGFKNLLYLNNRYKEKMKSIYEKEVKLIILDIYNNIKDKSIEYIEKTIENNNQLFNIFNEYQNDENTKKLDELLIQKKNKLKEKILNNLKFTDNNFDIDPLFYQEKEQILKLKLQDEENIFKNTENIKKIFNFENKDTNEDIKLKLFEFFKINYVNNKISSLFN